MNLDQRYKKYCKYRDFYFNSSMICFLLAVISCITCLILKHSNIIPIIFYFLGFIFTIMKSNIPYFIGHDDDEFYKGE